MDRKLEVQGGKAAIEWKTVIRVDVLMIYLPAQQSLLVLPRP